MDNNSIGIGDAMLLANQNGNGWGGANGGWWIWIFLLFFLMGGNGIWGNNNAQTNAELAAAKTQSTIWESNDQQNLMGAISTVRDGNIALGNGIADATFALNNTMVNGFNNTQRDIMNGDFGIQQTLNSGFNNTQYQMMNGINGVNQQLNNNRFAVQTGFETIGNQIEGVKYANALNTCNITTNSTANTQKILDRLTDMEINAKDSEIASLRQQLATANLTVSQYDQNAVLVNAIRPFPSPSYIVSSPYGTTSNSTCPYMN